MVWPVWIWTTYTVQMNHISIGISYIGIGCTTVLIASLYLFWFNFHDFARIRGASNYIGICKKTIFLQGHPLAESAMLYENKLHTVQLSSILTREGNEPWSYRPFQSKQIAVDQNKKYLHHTTIKNNLPYHVIFHWYGIQPHHSAVILTICMLLFIYQLQLAYYFQFQITPWWFPLLCVSPENNKTSFHTVPCRAWKP